MRVIYDIGANVGDKAEAFRHLADRVVCIEADPETARLLHYRFRGCQDVLIESNAVGSEKGRATLHRKAYSGFNTLSAKWAGEMDGQGLETNGILDISVTTFTDLIHTYGRPDYVKVDVEGYELQVISGLSVPVPIVSFE